MTILISQPSKLADAAEMSSDTTKQENGTKEPEMQNAGKEQKAADISRPSQDAELKDYQLGDCLGKGAHASVYRALNMSTGETVAVKQIKLADLPKSELRVITLEIDLLKNLDHPNIVKYLGFVKSSETLNILLEYCENGSLHSISKNFGKFPENLVALYMSQVLNGLVYLHEQAVIHRDIKGANILTTKQGLVKLADFGVATRQTTLNESSVVGTPYWMAPEVIELSGATTASDIWSLGCTVIELLDGKPPYHKLQPMHALFRIVNDDHPPMPEGASPIVRDFLTQCFQKDPNLRVSARKLLKHPWIVNACRSDAVIPKKSTKYEEAVKSVQEWNEALKSPESTLRKASRNTSASPVPHRRAPTSAALPSRGNILNKTKAPLPPLLPVEDVEEDNWDNDFDSAITPSALQLPHLKPQDHYGGLVSADKLKPFASFETVTEESNWDDDFEGEMTVKSPVQVTATDVSKGVRPFKAESKTSSPTKSPYKSSQHKGHAVVRPKVLKKTKSESHSYLQPALHYQENDEDDFDDLILANDGAFDAKLVLGKKRRSPPSNVEKSERSPVTSTMQPPPISASLRRGPPKPRISVRRTRSSIEMQRYVESEQDAGFSDVFAKDFTPIDTPVSETTLDSGTLMLNSKLSNNSWLGDDDDEDDPFALLEEGFDETDLDANVARDKYARLCTQVEALVCSLKINQSEETLVEVTDELLEIIYDSPETRSVCVSAHGMLPILEILEFCKNRDIIANLLRLINLIIVDDVEVQENLCFVGGIPIVTKFASRKYSSDIRLAAAAFVRQICETSTLTLQMFVSAGGLKVLVEFLEEDYENDEDERDLVMIGVNGVWSVFELQGPTPKNDFCRILSRSSVLVPLSLVLSRVLDEQGEQAELCEGRIANIFVLFSQAESHVKELVAERTVLHRVLKELKRMSPAHQVTMLKFIKNLSMLSTTLDALQNSNAIDVLIELLKTSMNAPHFREISNQVLNTIYNLCRLNKSRQEDAALNDIIPTLQRIYKTDRPLKEFTLPILCDMAHSGKVGRRELWRNKGLQFYISLLAEPYWQVTALDSIFIWLQEETARVEEHLMAGTFTNALTRCFIESKANAFENLLEPLQKLLRLSPPIAHSLAQADFFARIHSKFSSNKALTRLNLLRIVQCICDASDEQGALISVYGLYETIQKLADTDSAILVRDMASKLVRSCEEHEVVVRSGGKRRAGLRRASSSTTPPSLTGSTSMPPTPTSIRSIHSTAYILERDRSRHSNVNGYLPYRNTPRNRENERERVMTDDSRSATPTTTSSSVTSTTSNPISTPVLSRTGSRASIAGSLDLSRPGSSSGPANGKSRLPRTTVTAATPTNATGRSSRQSTVASNNRKDGPIISNGHGHRASTSSASTNGVATTPGNRERNRERDRGRERDKDKDTGTGSPNKNGTTENGATVLVPSSRRRRLQP